VQGSQSVTHSLEPCRPMWQRSKGNYPPDNVAAYEKAPVAADQPKLLRGSPAPVRQGSEPFLCSLRLVKWSP